ncbi:MAG: DUF2779 domain-containing protein [Planctomycetes bacterium]|nr:DUF2779 domain-containing protein [Planctomycetota bacterium]
MQALAEGGIQVGELVKFYYPNGHDIVTLNHDTALEETSNLLKQDEVTIFEAAIQYENLFIRADVLVKKGDMISLYEVKAKSSLPGEEFVNKKGFLSNDWKPYVYDVAFQHYVLINAFPNSIVKSHLSLIDKSTEASVDSLYQRFPITKIKERAVVIPVVGTSYENVGDKLIQDFELNDFIEKIYRGEHIPEDKKDEGEKVSFIKRIQMFSDAYAKDEIIHNAIGKQCGDCEFRANAKERAEGLLSGFHQCWSKQTKLPESDFDKPLQFELWRGLMGGDTVTPLIEKKKYFLSDIEEADIKPANPKVDPDNELSPLKRRLLQIEHTTKQIQEPYFNKAGVSEKMANWKYPLNFIDFETCMVAIPFHKGRKPYEQLAFQFSHHIVDENGNVEHKSQYLNSKKGEFPNFEFVRALKKELNLNEGTIFRYHNHENTVLKQIKEQLLISQEADATELIDFIDSITREDERIGFRDMVDLYKIVIQYFYHVSMKGSNSIKSVLPAVINSSAFLQKKYSQPIYGTKDLPSLNMKDITWVKELGDGSFDNPYNQLEAVYEGYDNNTLDEVVPTSDGADKTIKEGGAAMMAWAAMQSDKMSEKEHLRTKIALFKYCELDTLAMVMIYEYFKHNSN